MRYRDSAAIIKEEVSNCNLLFANKVIDSVLDKRRAVTAKQVQNNNGGLGAPEQRG